MDRNRPHLIVNGLGRAVAFMPKGGCSANRPSDVPDRRGHAQALLQAIDAIYDSALRKEPGFTWISMAGHVNLSQPKA